MLKRQIIKLVSKQDRSVNWILAGGQETRYVRRNNDYFIVYLSSHNGCNLSCRFCHLTQTNQTLFIPTTVSEFYLQAKTVLDYYTQQVNSGLQDPVKTIHFNWMARGEPLANCFLKSDWNDISKHLKKMALDVGVDNVKFMISTIMPSNNFIETDKSYLTWFFNLEHKPTFYYSLYSVSEVFRKKWLPKAIRPEIALSTLAKWQRDTGSDIVLHWAIIKEENDSIRDIDNTLLAVENSGIVAKFNLVRYNSFDESKSQEADQQVLDSSFKRISQQMLAPGSKIIPRVGIDIFASCGTFFNNT